MSAPQIFKNPEHQKKFDKEGFLVLPFLNEAEITHMDEMFDKLHGDLPKSGFYSGSYSSDMAYKKKVSEEIKLIFNRRYEEVFQNYTPFGGAYLVKIPSPDSDLFIHQDWTVVEESCEVALNIWTPLCDITMENGPLMVLPGSHHQAFPTLRAPTLRYFFDSDYKVAMRQMEPMLVKAGTSVILNQSLVHYSPPNISGKIRKAITAGVKTKDAQMIFHYKDASRNDNQIEKFEMDDDFFIRFENFFEDIYKRPTVGKSVGFIEYEVPMLRGDDLEKIVHKMRMDAGYDIIKDFSSSEKNIDVNDPSGKPSFWKIYTPSNIIREIRLRLTGE